MNKNKIYVIGIGPGAEEYLLPISKKIIKNSDCLVGSRRLLFLFKNLDKEKVYLDGNYGQVISYIKENRDKKRISVLVAGDTGLYSFLGRISRAFKKDEYCVIPGISALQLAFARMGESWEDAKIISFHGRKPQNLVKEAKIARKLFLFLDDKFPPQKVARYLLDKGIKNRTAIVFENLSYPNERIIKTNLVKLANMKDFGLCVMIIFKCRVRNVK
ncbi:MAG: precorrin-6y C5,15-methyltransferase (decarboxylating) subunit CbiE [Candidatus Omnitrophota bacterium]|nr:precorrin-6y C5,15-methyltransferase (decarboxylating) subunit CbiE [Candidatus Omnitrophota bacterium]